MAAKKPKEPAAYVLHGTSPACHWSWGYEPVLNRIEAVFGDQVAVQSYLGAPYDDGGIDSWLENYEMTWPEYLKWGKEEILPAIKNPASFDWEKEDLPASCVPVGRAVKAAEMQDPHAARHFYRAALFAFAAECEDVADEESLAAIAKSVGLETKRFLTDLHSEATLKAFKDDVVHMHDNGLNFFTLEVSSPDGKTRVSIEHAFDAEPVERAIEFIAGKKLKRAKPTVKDIGPYVAHTGPVSTREIQVVFGLAKPKTAEKELTALVKRGVLRVRPTKAGKFWEAVAPSH